MSLFIVQARGGRRSDWFDRREFDSRQAAFEWAKFEHDNQRREIDGWGGSSYTMRHPQHFRVVEVLANPQPPKNSEVRDAD